MGAYIVELLKVKDEEELLKRFESWSVNLPVFPVNGNRLKEEGINGKQIGVVLEKVRDAWIDNNFDLSEDVLVSVLSQFKTKENIS